MIMKAAVYCGKEDLRVKEVPVREPEDNEVVIRVKYCGVCGTDIHIFHGDGGCCDVKPPLSWGCGKNSEAGRPGSRKSQ